MAARSPETVTPGITLEDAAQLAKFRELAPEIDIVITTALIPNRPATKLWLEDMVKAMKPGSVILARLPDTGERYLSTPLFEGIPDGPDEGQELLEGLELQ